MPGYRDDIIVLQTSRLRGSAGEEGGTEENRLQATPLQLLRVTACNVMLLTNKQIHPLDSKYLDAKKSSQ